MHNVRRPNVEKFEALGKLASAYLKDTPLFESRVDFNSRNAILPEKYRSLPELCAQIQTVKLSKAHTKALKILGVKFLPPESRTANVVTKGRHPFVIFEDLPAEATTTTNFTVDSASGNQSSPDKNTVDITDSSCNSDITNVPPRPESESESEPIDELVDTFGTVLVDVTNRSVSDEGSSEPEELPPLKQMTSISVPTTRVSSRKRRPRVLPDL